jgi:4-amino-4-deoxy-L-arabinose transferase-like glycosyltransferase
VSRNIVALFALALAARLVALLVVGHPEMLRGDLVLAFDEPTYHRLAKTLATTGEYRTLPGDEPTAFRPPGAIVPLAILYLLFTPSPWVAVAYVMVCSLAIVAVVRAIAVLTTDDRRVWDTATLVAAVMPTLLWTTTRIWSDTPATLASHASLLLVLRAVRGARGDAVWVA